MRNILFVYNIKNGEGGIKVQVKNLIYHLGIENKFKIGLFNSKGSVIKRIILPFQLLFKSIHFDVLHAHGCSHWGGFYPILISIVIAKIARKRVIVTFHGGEGANFLKRNPNIVPYILKKVNVLAIPSPFLFETFLSYGLKPLITPNIINFEHSRIFKSEIKPNFISIRSLDPIYNVLFTIRAFSEIKITYPTATLLVLGDGVEKTSLERYVSENGICDVKFLGNVINSDVPSYLQKADIFLNSSLADNLPLSFLEAMSYGLIVISSAVGGIPCLVADGINGFLYETNNIESFVDKIRIALDDQKKSSEIIQNSQSSIELYNWNNVKDLYLGIYS